MTMASRLVTGAVLACLAQFAFVGAGSAAPSEPQSWNSRRELRSIPPGPQPIPVTIGAYLIDIERIEESAGACSLDGYLDLEWRDPRLARDAVPDLDRSHLTIDDIWSPNIEFYNQYDPRGVENAQLKITDAGTVTYEERYRARLGCDLDFRRFPFDRQVLPMQIESFRYDTSEMTLSIRSRHELKSARAFLPDWFILDAAEHVEVDTSNPDRRPYSMYVFETTVKRKAASYIWNIFIPLALITVLSWVVFWIRNKDFTNIAITTLVAAVAFAFVVSGSRPRQSYMTFMDAVLLSSYIVIFLANIAAVAIHYIDWTRENGRAAALTRTARWVFPLLYVVLIVVSIVLFFPPGA